MHQLILLYLEVFYLPIGHFQHGVESFSPSAYTALFYLLSVIDTTSFKIVGDFVSVPESPMCNSNRFISCRRLLDGHAGSAIKVMVAIHYSVLDARNGYIRNVVV